MRRLLILFMALYGFTLCGQEKTNKKPAYVIIANDQIITRERLNEYARDGRVKEMQKGVSQEERDSLTKKFGDKI